MAVLRSGDVNEAGMPRRVKLSKLWFEKPDVAARSYSRWMLVRVRNGLSVLIVAGAPPSQPRSRRVKV